MPATNRSFKIISVSPPRLTPFFDIINRQLRKLGHSVVHYTDYEELTRSVEAFEDLDVLLASGNFPCTRELMESAPHLRAVVCPFIGTEGFDEDAATELVILVAHGHLPEIYTGMAEATIMLILTSLYDLHRTEQEFRDNIYPQSRVSARMLQGKTVGLIGLGQIARTVVDRLSTWGATFQASFPRQHSPLPPGVTRVDLEDLLQTSDVVCVLANLNEETRNLLDARRLRLMKKDAVLINVARGGIINEENLVTVAQERPDLRIALDVFVEEPLPADSPLRDLPNAILTPHRVGVTVESITAIPSAAVETVTRVLRGELPLYIRNEAVIPAWEAKWAKND
jgi:D-3-phosphoglycerate dehydrogenase